MKEESDIINDESKRRRRTSNKRLNGSKRMAKNDIKRKRKRNGENIHNV